jgi:hypothetical protein
MQVHESGNAIGGSHPCWQSFSTATVCRFGNFVSGNRGNPATCLVHALLFPQAAFALALDAATTVEDDVLLLTFSDHA